MFFHHFWIIIILHANIDFHYYFLMHMIIWTFCFQTLIYHIHNHPTLIVHNHWRWVVVELCELQWTSHQFHNMVVTNCQEPNDHNDIVMSQDCISILPIALFFFIGQLFSHVVTKMPLYRKTPKTKLFTPKRKIETKKKT
jgi:hypothetical protein